LTRVALVLGAGALIQPRGGVIEPASGALIEPKGGETQKNLKTQENIKGQPKTVKLAKKGGKNGAKQPPGQTKETGK